MKKLIFILFLTVSGGILAQDQDQDALNNSEVSIQCKDYLDGKRNANAGFCLGYFYQYINAANTYWDNQRPSYSVSEKKMWDLAFPCRIKTGSEDQIIKTYYDYVQDNPLVLYDWSFLTIGKSLRNFC